ncbi:MAG: AhpC/TSA family protein [Duncaniella sp.]|nr:AhpC/TSA family protein [Duncaniella sp.]
MKHLPIMAMQAATAGVLLASCTMQAQNNYTVSIPAPSGSDGTMAYLVDWDSGASIDSMIVTSDTIRFKGNVADPFLGRIFLGGVRGPILVVEQGDITLNENGEAAGTPLNDRQNELTGRFSAMVKELRALDTSDSIQARRAEELSAEIDALPATFYKENASNPVGLYWFLQDAYEMSLDAIRAETARNPYLAASPKVKSVMDAAEKRLKTGPGARYLDFSVPYDGKLQKLSDYVKPGRYTLVDFWASWCGPCMRQAKVIKELYNRFHDRGLDVVGVAVWDEPQATLGAIETHGLAWPNIIDAQTVPTDLYGINAIPCIILIDPEGKIVSRDKQGQDLIDDVEKAMDGFTPAVPEVSQAPAAAIDTAAIF